jgi:thioredoxin 1
MQKSKKIQNIARAGMVITFLCILSVVEGIGVASLSAETAAVKVPSKPPSPSLPLLVDVGADKCIPCIMMEPILEELKKEYAGVLDVTFVDVWKNPEEAKKYRVRGIPTQVFYDSSGKELGRHMGFISKDEILESFRNLGVPLKKRVRK